jgi:hypothetical protein
MMSAASFSTGLPPIKSGATLTGVAPGKTTEFAATAQSAQEALGWLPPSPGGKSPPEW